MRVLRCMFVLQLFILCLVPMPALAQEIDSTMFQHLHWRMIGPHRAGRTVGAAGIPDQPNVFYIGVNNGGVWKTDDYGRTWVPVFDDQPTGSIGALAIAPSDPNIVYVGSGEGLQRPDLSVGDGMFRSTDAGKSWTYLGLSDAQQIGSIIVDPGDAKRVFVAVLGHPYGPNEQRGVFRSTDGGGSWQRILYKDENTGAIALAFDPSDRKTVYAVLWASRLGPWENGEWRGKTSGLFKSTDGGDTWRQLTGGLPGAAQNVGRIGFAIAPGDPSRMYALAEADSLGGVYRSDDAGEHWVLTNQEDRVYGRGSDFAEVKVDPRNKDIIFVANTAAYRSTDAGSTFTCVKGAPGGDDYHTIWINPLHPEIALLAADQGATITVNDWKTWSSWYNQPTAQFYHVATDNEFPYNVYGGQQESGSVGIVSRGNDGQITFREWHPVASDEWGYVAPDPLHPNLIFGGKVSRFDRNTGQAQSVAPEAIRSGKYRNLRTAPVLFSPVNPSELYFAANVLFRSTNGGHDWDIVSPDLSREQPDVPANVGIFRTPEMAHQARRGVIYSVSISPLDGKLIWAGTDDGLIHVTADGGKNWKNVTSAELTSWSKVAGIEAGHFDPATAYAAVNRIRLDDQRPHIYRTRDKGETWQEIVRGLPASGPVNVVREDPRRRGVLYAGTERAVYVSLDDGERWLPLRLNMPASSIRDLVIHNDDVIVGTHGRSFWILDDISSIGQIAAGGAGTETALFAPRNTVRVRWNMNTDTPLPPEEPAGENPPDGATIDYFLGRPADRISLEIADESGSVVRRYSSDDPVDTVVEKQLRHPAYWLRPPARLSATKGVHRFVWDLHYPPPESLPRSYPIAAVFRNTASQPTGPWVLPGKYQVTLVAGNRKYTQPLTVTMDPRVKASSGDISRQFELSMTCYRSLGQLGKMAERIHDLRRQIRSLKSGSAHPPDTLVSLDRKLAGFEGGGPPEDVDAMYFTVEGGSPVRESINGARTKFLYLMTILQGADVAPTTAQENAVADEEGVFKAMKTRWDGFLAEDLVRVNDALKSSNMRLK